MLFIKSFTIHQAFTGELTREWREENGVGLESWQEHILLDVLLEKPRNGYSPKPVNYTTKCKSMTLSATTSGYFEPKHFKYIDDNIPFDSYLWLEPGNILIQRVNSIDKVGTSAIYTGRKHEFIYPDLMMKLKIRPDYSIEYIAYYLKTKDVMQYFREQATGTAGNMPKINQKIVSNTHLKIPALPEQKEIVRILDDIFAKESQSKAAVESALAKIDTMKKAILATAFRGGFESNNSSDESAKELLRKVL